MTFTELAKARYSVRKYSDRLLEPGKLEQIMEAGLMAPTAKNNQPQRIYVLQSKESLDISSAIVTVLSAATCGTLGHGRAWSCSRMTVHPQESRSSSSPNW